MDNCSLATTLPSKPLLLRSAEHFIAVALFSHVLHTRGGGAPWLIWWWMVPKIVMGDDG